MRITPLMKLAAAALVSGLAVVGCGSTSTAGGGCGGTGCPLPTTGSITNFGSIFVNGVRYDTVTATVTYNGQPATEADLERGMVVTVIPTAAVVGTTAVAATVDYSDVVTGLVQANTVAVAVDPLRCLATGGAITAVGQPLQVNGETIFVNAIDPLVDPVGAAVSCYDGIAVGDQIEVSGYSDGNGSVFATLVKLLQTAPPISDASVSGVVSGLDSANTLFNIGTQAVNYGSATLVPGNLANGLYVRVKGSMGAGLLTANTIELEDDGDIGVTGNEENEVEVYGAITQSYSGGYFTLNGQRVQVTYATELGEDEDDGITLGVADLVAGTRVMVDGHLIGSLLVADEIQFHAQASVELQGLVQAVTASTVTVGGQVVTLNSSTVMIDEKVGSDRIFSVSEILVGDTVSVDAYSSIASAGGLVATRLERY